jgi:1-pyrroline-5-carboxylate dehydrogenase
MDYRPLEGFVYAVSPFNFTAIAGNLVSAPALMGNTIVWKPSYNQAFSANIIMKILLEAGLPKGVINLIYTDGIETAKVVLQNKDFAGFHFTGSTHVFNNLWTEIGKNINHYKSYPRIVGETGGKDYVLADSSAHIDSLAVALIRGAFEYQGQKCSAASRAYIPSGIWINLKAKLLSHLNAIKIGKVTDFSNFMNAVIHQESFNRLKKVIDEAHQNHEIEIVAGATYDDSFGYFINPTIFKVSNINAPCMMNEYFGPILSIYVYDDQEIDRVIQNINDTSTYALTGAIFSENESNIDYLSKALKHTAGNFYINDKPTGAVVNQQPFGGSRASGTNDKAGSIFNLIRWVSVQTIKRNSHRPTQFEYPFMADS